jgi:RNA polymerase sigma factor (sigma-70 family)
MDNGGNIYDNDFVEKLYVSNRDKFLKYCKTFKVDGEISIDIYQDAIVAFIEQSNKKGFKVEKSTYRTYLFAIGKFMLFAYLKKQNKLSSIQEIEEIAYEDFNTNLDTESITKIGIVLNTLGAKCIAILKAFYYQNKKLDDIVIAFNYENKDVAKSQKSRCLKQLKNLISNG